MLECRIYKYPTSRYDVIKRILPKFETFDFLEMIFESTTLTLTTIMVKLSVIQSTQIFHHFPSFRQFNGKVRNRRPEYGHICHQQLQIYRPKNSRFVFECAQIFVLTVSASILDSRY